MPTVLFPTTKIAPPEDPTERAIHDVMRIADTFEAEAARTTNLYRVEQLRERLKYALQALTSAENLVLLRADAILQERD